MSVTRYNATRCTLPCGVDFMLLRQAGLAVPRMYIMVDLNGSASVLDEMDAVFAALLQQAGERLPKLYYLGARGPWVELCHTGTRYTTQQRVIPALEAQLNTISGKLATAIAASKKPQQVH